MAEVRHFLKSHFLYFTIAFQIIPDDSLSINPGGTCAIFNALIQLDSKMSAAK